MMLLFKHVLKNKHHSFWETRFLLELSYCLGLIRETTLFEGLYRNEGLVKLEEDIQERIQGKHEKN